VLYKSPRTGAIDLAMDPRDPRHAVRGDCGSASGASGATRASRTDTAKAASGKPPTADARGRDASAGLPAPRYRGRIGIDIVARETGHAVCACDNYEIGRMPAPVGNDPYGRPMPAGQGFITGADVYRSDDAGKTWQRDEPD
jgi:hypothetical protein